MDFIFIDRAQKKTIALLPGWATDARIFGLFNIKYNYLLPAGNVTPFSFEHDLKNAITKYHCPKISLLGWSLGGFLAARYVTQYPASIEELFLIGIRRRYPAAQIRMAKTYLKQDKKAYLNAFYQYCFLEQKARKWFYDTLFEEYCTFEESYLIDMLDFLETIEIVPAQLMAIKNITIIHGARDEIAPIEEVRSIAQAIPGVQYKEISSAGHAPFLLKENVSL